ncbi:efflux RND transporter periplasmic adaptor subunit [Rhodanobacter sp. C01]|uniref:efflux RND transporter periplasmic adaptor subunit n=1 Tax=Rhodanobacter sp. C01 TaxID=1945856 RepID=UPI0009CAA8A1|nr:efflux RND transporter periplasmic adaptor subunit [Rhodanobacter sp. C01]OOG46668.1 efflux transporter periplasmic adaptor subunit [Rhodanobacter sp. C01]
MIVPWKKLWILALVLGVFAAAMYFTREHQAPDEAGHTAVETAVPVTSALATRGDIDLSLNVVARTEAWSTVTMQARSSGQLESLGFAPGTKVKKGGLLAQLDPLPFKAQLDQARGNADSARAQWDKAQADLKRYSQVLAKGYISRASFDTYQTNVEVARANLQTSEAAQEIAQLQLGYTRITAPFDGVTGLPLVWPGAQVTANSTDIVVLNQIEPIRISFSIPEASLAAVRDAQSRGPVAVQARLPGDNRALLHGTLEFVDNTVDVNTSTIVLKGRFENTDGRLTPGQFMQVSLPTVHLLSVVSMPAQALQSSDKGNFVFVIGADGKAHQRFVGIGPTTSGRIVIEHGLEAGERVVTDGQLLLSDGSAVRMAAST